MNIENTIIGAYAHVYLETEEDIESVAKKFTRGLLIPLTRSHAPRGNA